MSTSGPECVLFISYDSQKKKKIISLNRWSQFRNGGTDCFLWRNE